VSPLPVDNLTPDSSPQAVKDAISASIAQCIKEGKDQKQCAGIAYSIAREKSGKEAPGAKSV
jgi:hypothetical protein